VAPRDDWGRIVAEGRAARAAADGGFWRIGHLALLVEKRYRSGSLQRFADDIGESYATVRRYRWVVKRYGVGVRFRYPLLSFSHFQAVAGLPDRMAWLERAAKGCWSVDRLVRESRAVEADSPASAGASLARARQCIGQLRRCLDELFSLDEPMVVRAGDEWLNDALAAAVAEIERLRGRIRTASGPPAPVQLVPFRVRRLGSGANGNGHGANGNGHRANGKTGGRASR